MNNPGDIPIRVNLETQEFTTFTLRDMFACFIMAKPDTTPVQAYGLADMMIEQRKQY